MYEDGGGGMSRGGEGYAYRQETALAGNITPLDNLRSFSF